MKVNNVMKMLIKWIVPNEVKLWFQLIKTRFAHGRAVKIDSPFVSPRCVLGKGVYVGYDSVVDHNVSIGRYTSIGIGNFIVHAEIGAFCAVANNTFIGLPQHDYRKSTISTFLYTNIRSS